MSDPLPSQRLLLVEDEFNLLFAIREYFATIGFAVDCASSYQDAARLLAEFTYDALITDLHLTPSRQAEGLEVLSFASARQPSLCLLMLTAFASAETIRSAHALGAVRALSKPISLQALAALIGELKSTRDGGETTSASGDRVV